MFKVGDKVGLNYSHRSNGYGKDERCELRYNPDDSKPDIGEVVNVSLGGKITVKWNQYYSDSINKEHKSSDLILEADLLNKLVQLKTEYDALFYQIKDKVQQASEALKEANQLAASTNRSLAEMHDVVYGDLYNAMDECGWQTSSFGC